jgi:hypothetical protein
MVTQIRWLRVFIFGVAMATVALGSGLRADATEQASAQAEVIQQVLTIPVGGALSVPCANGGQGDTVSFSGIYELVFLGVITPNGITGPTRERWIGASGVSLTTGDQYQVSYVSHASGQSIGSSNFRVTYTIRLVGPGPSNNLTVTQTVQLVMNANGTVVVESFSLPTVTCR